MWTPGAAVTETEKAQILKWIECWRRAAAELFSTPGYPRVQVADITQAAGTGVGTFYRYFGEKEKILHDLLQDFLGNIRTRVATIREGIESMQPAEQIAVVRETFALMPIW